MMEKRASYDFYLILATTVVLFAISIICVYGMFYFKFAQVQEMPAAAKLEYMNQMNRFVSPFLIGLILLLGICVPKRLLPTIWLNRFAVFLLLAIGAVAYFAGIQMALKVNLIIALALQFIVLFMALSGSEILTFEKKGYWVRVGSSAMHLGIILFILDLFYYQNQGLHLVIFWMTTFFTVVGMMGCFYSEAIVSFIKKHLPSTIQ